MPRSPGSSSESLDRAAGPPTSRIYLDYAGFSPVDPRVVAFMRPFREGGVGNPAALHSHGLEARASLDGARAKGAGLVGGAAGGVTFTASATEANNLALKGSALRARGRHLVTSAVEHVSIVNPCRDLAKQGWTVTAVPVDREGLVDPQAVAAALRDDTALVSVMAANGEIGTVQPGREIGRLARARRGPFHVDGVGPVGRLPHHASLVVPGVKADAVLLELDLRGVAASSGSACNLTTGEPSHVLRAIGCTREEYEGSLCFTLGRWTTAAEIDSVLDVLPGVVSRLRRLAAR